MVAETEPNGIEALRKAPPSLVDQLVGDLRQSQELQMGLKLQAVNQAQHIAERKLCIDVLQQECTRLQRDNNELHLQIIRDAETHDKLQKEQYLQYKSTEDRLAELTFWKRQAVLRFLDYEKENDMLKKKLIDMERLAVKRNKGTLTAQASDIELPVDFPWRFRSLVQYRWSFLISERLFLLKGDFYKTGLLQPREEEMKLEITESVHEGTEQLSSKPQSAKLLQVPCNTHDYFDNAIFVSCTDSDFTQRDKIKVSGGAFDLQTATDARYSNLLFEVFAGFSVTTLLA